MSIYLRDSEIQSLLKEKKIITEHHSEIFQLKDKEAHKEQEAVISREDGSEFRIILRQNKINIIDFSVIVGYVPKGSNLVFKLRRYNGKSHQHTNKIEKQTFFNYHIHTATERYQDFNEREESFAEITDRYTDIKGAFNCLVEDCNIKFEDDNQIEMDL